MDITPELAGGFLARANIPGAPSPFPLATRGYLQLSYSPQVGEHRRTKSSITCKIYTGPTTLQNSTTNGLCI